MKLDLILKMLGVKVAPETVAQIEAVLPQLPSKIQGVIALVNAAVQNFDERIKDIEFNQRSAYEEMQRRDRILTDWLEGRLNGLESQLGRIEDGRTDSGGDTRPAGTGATERAAIERVTNGRSD